jgi:hypothetical protein
MRRLSIAFAFLLFISCKKENNRFSIVGKWQLIESFDANTAWGGCNCWKVTDGAQGHTVEFASNGTYHIIPSLTNGFNDCSGDYERKNDSTLVWSRCGANTYEAKLSHEGPFLLIEEHAFGGYTISKYKRIR